MKKSSSHSKKKSSTKSNKTARSTKNKSLLQQLISLPIGVIFAVVMVITGFVTLAYLQVSYQTQNLDDRTEAQEGLPVEAVGMEARASGLVANEPGKIEILAETGGLAIKRVTTRVVLRNVALEDVNITHNLDTSQYEILQEFVNQLDDGAIVIGFSFESLAEDQAFSNNSLETIFTINFTPTEGGTLRLAWQPDNMRAYTFYDQNTNIIATPNLPSFFAVEGEPNQNPDPTPTPTPTPGSNRGGTQLKSCNENCSSSSECKIDHFCYQDRCRLAINPASSSCSEPSGIDDNQDAEITVVGCNQACSSNSECETNLRCYFGSCRLATNPSNTSCVTSSTTTPPAVTTPSTPPKGGTDGSSNGVPGTPGSDGSGNRLSPAPFASATPTAQPDETTEDNQSFLDRIMGMISLPENTPMPLILIGAGFLLLVLLALATAINFVKGNADKPIKRSTPGSSTPPPSTLSTQDRIKTIREQQALKSSHAPTSMSGSVSPVPPSTLRPVTPPPAAPHSANNHPTPKPPERS